MRQAHPGFKAGAAKIGRQSGIRNPGAGLIANIEVLWEEVDDLKARVAALEQGEKDALSQEYKSKSPNDEHSSGGSGG